MAGRELRRDLLIEHLHVIQDTYGHISAAHLAALAERMRLPQAEVYEVATFYHHFDVVKEGETPPPAITIRVCDSLSCAMAGAAALTAALERGRPANVRVVQAPCMGLCDQAPAAAVGRNYVGQASGPQLLKLAEAHATRPVVGEHQSYDAYCHGGGYETLKNLRAGEQDGRTGHRNAARGRAPGARRRRLPVGQEMAVRAGRQGPRYLCINGDEGEPGTFKDRITCEPQPHQFLEGMLIAAWGVEAEKAYHLSARRISRSRDLLLKREIARWSATGLSPPATSI